jgi:hypothetical protein
MMINIYPLYCIIRMLKLNLENSKYLKSKIECGGISLNEINIYPLYIDY